MYYLTEDDYLKAEKNGISRKNLYNRHYILGWSVEKSITEPMKVHKVRWKHFEEKCQKVGLSRAGFFHRIERGMDPELASSIPPTPKGGHFQNRPGKLTKIDYEVAAANGIKRGTVMARVYSYGWSVEEAVSLKSRETRVRT